MSTEQLKRIVLGKNTYVTQPSMPDLAAYEKCLEQIWESKEITNNGIFHKQFEKELCRHLEVGNVSLFANGTLALILALKALRITGEVITTPYSFVATTHALHWNGIKPVFCDINEHDCNINPNNIEVLITSKTTAIMPVHVYGNPSDNDKIKKIADVYGLKVIYDAAHTFGVKKNDESVLNWGDISILSFHATKVFNTVEGGAVVTKDEEIKKRIDYLKNFGFVNETTVTGYGINAKMNELIAAYGLLQLKNIDEQINKRKKKVDLYRKLLKSVDGVTMFYDDENIKYNYSYFPILIDKHRYGQTRDQVYEKLKGNNIYARRYFYPLISQFPAYKGLPSSKPANLPIASKISEQVLCLPLYPDLEDRKIIDIVNLISYNNN